MQILCILLALMMVAAPAEARVVMVLPTAEQLASAYPPEMMFKGKPLNPSCVEATNPTEGPSVPQDLNTCPAAPEGKEIKGGLVVLRNNMIGHNYICAEDKTKNFCGFTGYKYLGKVEGGVALETLTNGGGTGQFSSIILLKRDGDTITSDIIQETGDRCSGGILGSEMKDGVVEYRYNIALSELYADYKTDGSFAPPAGSPLDCAAVVRKKGETILDITLNRTSEQLKNDLFCFSDPYREYTKSGAALSEEQVKKFFVRVEEKCAQEE